MENKRFNEKRKVNQTSMICYAVLVFILFAAYMLELVKGNRTVGYIMIFDIILLVPLALALLTYKKNNESAALRYMIRPDMACCMCLYFLQVLRSFLLYISFL